MKTLALVALLVAVVGYAHPEVPPSSWNSQLMVQRQEKPWELTEKFDEAIRARGDRPVWLAGYAMSVANWQMRSRATDFKSPRPPSNDQWKLALARAKRAAELAPGKAYPLTAAVRVWIAFSTPDVDFDGPSRMETVTVTEPNGRTRQEKVRVYRSGGPIDENSLRQARILLKEASRREPNDGEVLSIQAALFEKESARKFQLMQRAGAASPTLATFPTFMSAMIKAADDAGQSEVAAMWRERLQAALAARPNEEATRSYLAGKRRKERASVPKKP